MPYFKDQENKLHFLSDDDVLNGWAANLPSGCVKISDDEAKEIENPAPTSEQLAAKARAERDAKLAETSWLIERHNEQLAAAINTALTENQYAALLAYRQALRDIPAQPGFPNNIIWPEKP